VRSKDKKTEETFNYQLSNGLGLVPLRVPVPNINAVGGGVNLVTDKHPLPRVKHLVALKKPLLSTNPYKPVGSLEN